MTSDELKQHLARLGLDMNEAAQLLSVTPRTVRRWLDGEDIPGPAEQAILAWVRLHNRHLPWRPDAAALIDCDQEQIERHRQHSIDLEALLARVEARRGPIMPWEVNWDHGTAKLGSVELTFYKLANGGFSVGSYRRTDRAPDPFGDRELIEGGVYVIAQTLKSKNPENGPVNLVLHRNLGGGVLDQRFVECGSIREAIKLVFENQDTPEYHEPFIMATDSNALYWDAREIRMECERRRFAPPALKALAKQIRGNSQYFDRGGPQLLPPNEVALRRQRIEFFADKIDELAEQASEGFVGYQDFDVLLSHLHELGFFPAAELVSEVARALVRG